MEGIHGQHGDFISLLMSFFQNKGRKAIKIIEGESID
jgi:hypothetical protein